MKRRILKIVLMLLGAIIGLFGGSLKCFLDNDNSPDYKVEVLYGAPYATYILDGTIVNKALPSNTINGIQVEWNSYNTLSATNGTWIIERGSNPLDVLNYTLIATDIDGTQNGGLFLTTTVSGTFLVEDPVSSTSYLDSGKFTAHNIVIEMSKSN